MREKLPDLHLHSLDLFDSQNDPKDVCRRLADLKSEGFALTQHGVLSGIEPMREAAASYGLKFIPGIETYFVDDDLYGRQHLILLAKDDLGYRELGKAVTAADDKSGFSVMHLDTLQAYFGPGSAGHGHVIATTACIQGPAGVILRQSEFVSRKKAKLLGKGAEDVSEELEKAKKAFAGSEKELALARKVRDDLQKRASAKTDGKIAALEKKKGKLEKEVYDKRMTALMAAKLDAATASSLLPGAKDHVTKLSKRVTELRQEVKRLTEAQEKYDALEAQLSALDAKTLSPDGLLRHVREKLQSLAALFGKDCFYAELQYHGIPAEKEVYPALARIAYASGIPVIATNDVHIVSCTQEERLRRQILRFQRFGDKWEEEQTGDSELYIKTDDELYKSLSEILPAAVIEDAFANTWKVFDSCSVEFHAESHNPKFTDGTGRDTTVIFHDALAAGKKWRFPHGMPDGYEERLSYEVGIIEKMGYVDYHLIVKDFLEYARTLAPVPPEHVSDAPLTIPEAQRWVRINGWKGGISTGLGRGSAVGSLVCYLLGITALDPLKYDLLFERFLNPERVSMPDIDSDIAKNVRPQVIRYVRHKYGEDSVCGIMTMNAQAPRGAIRIAAKAYGYAVGRGGDFLSLGDEIAKKVSKEPGTSFATVLDNKKTVMESLKSQYYNSPDARKILDWAALVEGCFTAYGAHAAGIVISDNHPVSDYVPLRWNSKLGEWTTQCDMVVTESKGLLKMDFLGLKTLDVMNETLSLIKQKTGRVIIPERDIPMDDADVYREIYCKGATDSVFQFESQGMKQMLKRFQPDCFEDLIILVSMFRPGPLQYLDGVIEVKHGKPASYLVPELMPILGSTYSAIVYQEQVMQIFRSLAGYTLGQADQVRRFMSKKKADKLAKERTAFVHGDVSRGIDGCEKRGIDPKKADELFDQMTEFSRYAFNKSHAAAYAADSYYTAWLKYHYPAEFLCAAMNWAEDKSAEDRALPGLMREARNFGVTVKAPDINLSHADFTIHDGCILTGLGSVKSVGADAAQVIAERNANGLYLSIPDFLLRTKIRSSGLTRLIEAGAFDGFCKNRTAVLDLYTRVTALLKRRSDKQQFLRKAELVLPYLTTVDSAAELLAKEEELGIGQFLKKQTKPEVMKKRMDTAGAKIGECESLILAARPDVSLSENFVERMGKEHALLGAYLSAHPLDTYIADANASAVKDVTANDSVTVCGIVTEFRELYTRRDHRPMAAFLIEDRTGTLPAVLFPAVYAQYEKLIAPGCALRFTGTCSLNGDDLQMNCEEVHSLEEARGILIEVADSWTDAHTEALRARYGRDSGHLLTLWKPSDAAIETGIRVDQKFIEDYKKAAGKEVSYM